MPDLTPKQCLNHFLELLRMTDLAYMKLLKRWNLSLNATWALEYMVEHPEGVEPAVLAESTRMLRQTVTVVLNDLEERGVIRREPHRTDRRRKLIKLTKEGKIFAADVLSHIEQIELRSIVKMTPAERNNLVRLTTLFYEGIRQGDDN